MKSLLAACVVMLLAASAFAQSSSKKADATTAFRAGQALYLKADYEGAARQFKTAYDLDPDAVYLFNIAQAHRLAKKCADAGEYYRRYLAEAKKAPNAETVKASIVEVDECAKEQAAAAAAAAAAAEPPVVAPAPAPVAEREPMRDEPPRSNKRLVGYIVGGGGVALAGLGFLFMSQVNGLEDDANAVCPNPCMIWDNDKKTARADIDDRAALREKLMIGSWIAGGAAIAAGVYLVVTGGAQAEHGVAITPTRNGAMATIRF